MLINVLLAVGLVVTGVGSSAAAAGNPVSCPPGQNWNAAEGVCVVVVEVPSEPPTPGTGGHDGGGAGSGKSKCVNKWSDPPDEVDCTTTFGYWSNHHNCWVKAVTPPPPADDAVWEGHYPEGGIYLCTYPAGASPGTGGGSFWSLNPPAGPTAPPNPRVLAEQAITRMNLRAITIGLVPESGAGSVGLVGVPNWMWVQAPSPSTWGPITRSASAAGWTVTATARVSRVSWDMGDGQVVSCGAGTPYRDSFGMASSPDCGHVYTRQGEYTVQASSHWVIEWSGIGQAGTITMDLARSVPVTIGEAQVLRQ